MSQPENFVQLRYDVLRDPALSLQEKTVYAEILSYSTWGTANGARPSQMRMCAELNITSNTFTAHRNQLGVRGLLIWQEVLSPRGRTLYTRYYFPKEGVLPAEVAALYKTSRGQERDCKPMKRGGPKTRRPLLPGELPPEVRAEEDCTYDNDQPYVRRSTPVPTAACNPNATAAHCPLPESLPESAPETIPESVPHRPSRKREKRSAHGNSVSDTPTSGHAGRFTWLINIGTAWSEIFAGEAFPYAVVSKTFKELFDNHGKQEVERKWRAHLLNLQAQQRKKPDFRHSVAFATRQFAEHYGTIDGGTTTNLDALSTRGPAYAGTVTRLRRSKEE